MYVNKVLIAGEYVLIKNYTPRLFGAPGKKRREKKMETPKAMARYNNQKRAEKLQLLMLLNFEKGYHVTLDYPKESRPQTYKEAEENLMKSLFKISRRLRKKGKKFKYIAITERGRRREALHHHLIIESDHIVLQELSDVWGNHLKLSQMYEEGAYKDLAEYFCKIETKEEQKKGKSKYHRSRNLKEPQAKSQIIAGPLKDELYIPKGYELVPESASSGFNDFAGIRYQKYMIKKAAALDSEKTLNKREDIPKKRSFWEKLKNKFRKGKRHE
ncbi:MAG: hypothetical protein J6S67_08880 [Methanobrevibacter sp.]|nr:hypothetical protein [Methanobrevibacter sp.]